VTLRAIEQAKLDGDHALAEELEKDWEYGSVHTCAVDGLCQTACPVNINTATLVKRFRRQQRRSGHQRGLGHRARNTGAPSPAVPVSH